MSKLLSMPIRKQMIVLLTIMSVVPFGLVCYSAFTQRAHEISEATAITARVAGQIQNEQNLLLAGAEQLAATLTQVPDVKKHDSAAVNSLLADILKTNQKYYNIALVDKSGSLWASALPAEYGLSLADRRFFKNAVASGKVSSGEYALSKARQTPIFSFGYPVTDHSGTVSDVLIVTLALENYRDLYTGQASSLVSSSLLVDHKGTILYSSENPELVGKQDRTDLFKGMVAGPDEGDFEARGNLDILSFFTYKKLRLKDETTPYMYVRTGLSAESVFARVNRELLFNAGILLLAVFISLGVVLYAGKRGIFDKIVAIRDATQRISRGDFDVRIADSISGGELGELASAFDAMAEQLSADTLSLSQAYEAQRASESKYRELVEKANSIILKWDCDGRITFFNEFAETFFGFSGSEIVGQNAIGTIVPETESSGRNMVDLFRNIFNNPAAFINNENENTRKNGERVWVSWTNHPLADPDGKIVGFLSVGQDITKRKQAEEKLRQSEAKFSAAFKASPDAVILSRLSDGSFLEVNEGFTALTGYVPEEVLGRSSNELQIWVDPEQRVQLVRKLKEHGIAKDVEAHFRRKDGSILVGHISARVIEINGEPYILSITRDITEWQQIQQELLKAQKLESISVLAGGIAHNFNNVLTGVIGYISYAKKHLNDSGKLLQILESAEKSSYRAAALARQLLTFSQGSTPVRKPVSVDTLVQESVSLFLSGTNVKGVIECTSHQTIDADSQQINQAFNNIVLNALQAMPNGGNLTVRADAVTLKAGNKYALQPATYIRIVFEDTGNGIEKDDLGKIFDPYFTTKECGTGLGLSTTHSIISKHGGSIDISSQTGQGTTVTIFLPASAEEHPGDERVH
ncbi:MAG: PAS domain S-box protein [Verrucomicrobia bacterium]|nr:PAS domain S-box protein [Deltaproteobacteria bacterium]